MSVKKLLPILFACCATTAIAQEHQHTDRCNTMQHLEYQLKQDPTLQARMQAAENAAVAYEQANQLTPRAVITIPVVVHVVYSNAAGNLSDAMVQSQIDVLNEDFAAMNADINLVPSVFQPLISNTQIQFCLAQRDPQNNPTTGIIRVPTTTTSFDSNNGIKFTAQGGSDAWDASKYLNLWTGNLGNNLLGYAQFPGGAAATDGVVILNTSFGRNSPGAPYNLGRTATHEVGHWLNLNHIWGDDGTACTGSDNVADTPNQAGQHFGCPTFPTVSCSNGPNGDMFMNYMDYTDDRCMYMFTAGQATRMNACLNTTRASLLTSNGCLPPVLATLDASIMSVLSPSTTGCTGTNISPQIRMRNMGQTALTAATISFTVSGGTAQTYNWTGNLASLATADITLPAQTTTVGAHTITATVTTINGTADPVASNNTQTASFTVVPNLDGSLTTLTSPIGTYCNGQVVPSMTLKNAGATALTTAVITYSVDGGANQTYNWTGNIAGCAQAVINLPALVTVTAGTHTFAAQITTVNATADPIAANNAQTSNFTYGNAAAPISNVMEGFEAATFPAAGFTLDNPDNDYTWERSTAGASTGTASMFIDNWTYDASGQKDELVLPGVNLTAPNILSTSLTFQHAYKYYGATNADSLAVLVSTDCGNTWTRLFYKGGADLGGIRTTAYTAPAVADFVLNTIDLTPYSSPNTVVKFSAINDFGNNLYVDDINIQSVLVSTQNIATKAAFTIQPNPAHDAVTVNYTATESGKWTLELTDVSGKLLRTMSLPAQQGANTQQIEMSGLAAGCYFVKMTNGTNFSTQKLILN